MKEILISLFITLAVHVSWGSFTPPTEWQNLSQFSSEVMPGQAEPEDSDLIRAIRDRRRVYFLKATRLPVIQLLSDDLKGSRHQRWVVRTSSGARVLCVYNIDFAHPVPLDLGDSVDVGGEFIWTSQGPLIHWLHADPSRRRPDGFVILDGQRFGIPKSRRQN